jgi:ectoine hydroxylase-related dioxygenase (phytanoyl-CoA dioxygenase family)
MAETWTPVRWHFSGGDLLRLFELLLRHAASGNERAAPRTAAPLTKLRRFHANFEATVLSSTILYRNFFSGKG